METTLRARSRRPVWRTLSVGAALAVAACGKDFVDAPATPSLDTQVRQTIQPWGVLPIGPLPAQNPALVDLGRALFFDKILSGNRDVSCATCHTADMHLGDGLSLSIGTGGAGAGASRTLGSGRQFVARNASTLLNQGLNTPYLFWDGRVSVFGAIGPFNTPAGNALPGGVQSLLAAQAMFPVTERVEMRGAQGDHDVFGAPNELADVADDDFVGIWAAVMRRVLAVNAYLAKFNAAFPGTPANALGFQHAANAIAAFEADAFTRTNSPFDRFLLHDDNAMSTDAKRGALLFFGKARCSQCHGGPLLGGQQFASAGVPQIGPGVGSGAPLDIGRQDLFLSQKQLRFLFRVPPLRNVELTAPYMHDGAFTTLDAVVRHYNDVSTELRHYDPMQLDATVRATYHGDDATITAILSTLDVSLQQPLNLSADEQRLLVEFLKSLTDPAARNLAGIIPASVPSGLPLP